MAENASYSECCTATGELRQGDVIRFVEPDGPYRSIGVIITGDCDIDKDKHAGILSYVPVLTVSEYIDTFFIRRKLDEIRQSVESTLLALMRQAQSKNLPQFPTPLSHNSALDWLRRLGAEAVAAELCLTTSKEKLKFVETAAILDRLDRGLSEQTSDRTTLYAEIAVALKRKKTRQEAREQIGKEILSYMKRLPGDAMYLNSINAEFNAGYVAYLRLVREINDRHIELDGTTRLNLPVARRVARLQAPFIYHLTQGVASVFSDIGLPSAYEDARDLAARKLFSGEEGTS